MEHRLPWSNLSDLSTTSGHAVYQSIVYRSLWLLTVQPWVPLSSPFTFNGRLYGLRETSKRPRYQWYWCKDQFLPPKHLLRYDYVRRNYSPVLIYSYSSYIVFLVNRSYEDAPNALWTFIMTNIGLTLAAVVQQTHHQLSFFQALQVSNLVW